MTAIASPEFIALCRTQLQLLTQQLTRSSAALYIADITSQRGEEANFVAVASYPEPVESWVENFERASAANFEQADTEQATHLHPNLDAEHSSTHALALPGSAISSSALATSTAEQTFSWPRVLQPEQRIVTPLVYTDVVVGLLVAVRPDRAWNSDERKHIEAVGASLAGGCVLERRNQWLQAQLSHKRGLQSRQSEVFHNLLHQFRNPLTAVSTFGQLMVKRLGPEDPNAPVATGIVRENKRLRELVSHFDEAVAIGDADIAADQATSRPQLGPQQSLLTASEVSETVISEALISDESSEVISLPIESSADAQMANASHGLGQPLVLSAQHLPDIIQPVLAVASIVASEKGVSLQSQVAADTPPVWGEEEALGEVVTNLVDNAIKYSPVGASVWVQTGVSYVQSADNAVNSASAVNGASAVNSTVNSALNKTVNRTVAPSAGGYQGIVVGDTGPGIPAGDLPRLFERNYRGVQAESDIPGTGLGLAIAQSLIQEMHGFIEVITPAVGTPWLPTTHQTAEALPGAGTVFIVWLLEVDRRGIALAA